MIANSSLAPRVEYKESILRVQGVSLTLGDNLILRDVELEIRDLVRPDTVTGQVVGLLGPSGVGKTQLLRIIAGLNPPDSGTVLLGAEGKPVERGAVGVVAQHYPLFGHRTVIGNLMIAGRRGGWSRDAARQRAMELLERFHLSDRHRHYPVQLSGGQRQRVAIAQQLMCSNYFLLLDEPFSGLDPLAIDQVCALIAEVAGMHELNTIIVITHDINSALRVSDTLWLLGRDGDAAGRPIPGARIQERICLIERGLAWHPQVESLSAFVEVAREVRRRFASL